MFFIKIRGLFGCFTSGLLEGDALAPLAHSFGLEHKRPTTF